MAGLSCSGKDSKMFTLSAGCVVPSSLRRSKIAGYATKESVPRWLLHVSANFEADIDGPCPCGDSGGRGGRERGFSVSSLFFPLVRFTGGEGLGGGNSGDGTWPVPTCSHIIASSSPSVVVVMYVTVGCFGAGGAGGSSGILTSVRSYRLSISLPVLSFKWYHLT